MPALSWFPVQNGFDQKRIAFEFASHRFWAKRGYFKSRWKKTLYAAKRSLSVEKQSEDSWCLTKQCIESQNITAVTGVNFFFLLRVALLVLQIT